MNNENFVLLTDSQGGKSFATIYVENQSLGQFEDCLPLRSYRKGFKHLPTHVNGSDSIAKDNTAATNL